MAGWCGWGADGGYFQNTFEPDDISVWSNQPGASCRSACPHEDDCDFTGGG